MSGESGADKAAWSGLGRRAPSRDIKASRGIEVAEAVVRSSRAMSHRGDMFALLRGHALVVIIDQ